MTRIDKLIVDMEHGTQKILNLAWDMEKSGQIQILGADGSINEEQVPVGVAAATAPLTREVSSEGEGLSEQSAVSEKENVLKAVLGRTASFFAPEKSKDDTE